jgi:ribosome recycling factor
MKRSIGNELNELYTKLSNLSGVFGYQLQNLCVKAEPVALLTIEVNVEGENQKLEDCTTVAKKDDYSFTIVPHYEDDIPALEQGIFKAHPEFKLKKMTMTVDSIDLKGNPKEVEVPYILATMPDVTDERYNILNEGVKLLYENCKAKMEAAILKSDAKLAGLLVGESKDTVDEVTDAIDMIKKEWNDKREQTRDDKLKEIEDAYQKWLAKFGLKKQ